MLLENRAALVTGASRGIGRAIALALARQGARVAVNYTRQAEAARQVVEEIEALGGEAFPVQADVRDAAAVDTMVGKVGNRYGRLDILVNNAGIIRDGLLVRMKEEDWQEVLDTNLKGVFYCTRAAARLMIRQRRGRIINLASVVGLMGNAGQANYASAKAGIIGFTRAVARELAPRGITVNAVAPGFIETDMTAGLSPRAKERLLEAIPMGRLGRPEEVAGVVVFLASEAANYITGQTIAVDGGMVMT